MFETRARLERRVDVAFGLQPDYAAALIRTRLSMNWRPLFWLEFHGMMQDSRAPGYGSNAPSNLRDPADLQEGYVTFRTSHANSGLVLTAGRLNTVYGEGRLIGTQNWLNVPRPFDLARLRLVGKRSQIEVLYISPVKARPDGFNRPQLGDFVWGTYNSFPDLFRKNLLEFYVLRRTWERTGVTGVNTFGLRLAGPLTAGWRYGLEGALQNGSIRDARHRAGAWYSSLNRGWEVFSRALDTSIEYKYASGSADPADRTVSGTFDQLHPTNHDKFGHEDLFGWRNIHNLRSVSTYAVTKIFNLNFMYDNFWLSSRRDFIYSAAGNPVLRDPAGQAGRHVGQEFDWYATWRYPRFLFGAGYAFFVQGEFIRNTRPNASPSFLYVFYTYSF
jgi:hypothetical protein